MVSFKLCLVILRVWICTSDTSNVACLDNGDCQSIQNISWWSYKVDHIYTGCNNPKVYCHKLRYVPQLLSPCCIGLFSQIWDQLCEQTRNLLYCTHYCLFHCCEMWYVQRIQILWARFQTWVFLLHHVLGCLRFF